MNAGTLRLQPLPLPDDTDKIGAGHRAKYCDALGVFGCGQCPKCKQNARRALAKQVESDRPYLGPKSFDQLFPEPRHLRSAYAPDANRQHRAMTQGWIGGHGPKYGAYNAYAERMTEPIGGWELYAKAYPGGREF